MELVYLWVEEYKNIHKQGFNFSPRFHCKYDDKTNELTIDENDDYIPDFFGKNINVTTIVGKNGSGKSTLMELLLILFYGSKEVDTSKENRAWLITYDSNQDYFKTYSWIKKDILYNKIITNNNILQEQYQENNDKKVFISSLYKPQKNYYNIVYNPAPELMSSDFLNYGNKYTHDFNNSISMTDNKPLDLYNITFFPSRENSIINIKKNENIDILNMFKVQEQLDKNILIELFQSLNTDKLNFIPKKIKLLVDYESLESSMSGDGFLELLGKDKNISDFRFLYRYLLWQIMLFSVYDPVNDEFSEFFIDNQDLSDFFTQKIKNISDKEEKKSLVTQQILDDLDSFIELTRYIDLSKAITNNSKRLKNDVLETAKLIEVIKRLNNKNIFDIMIEDVEVIKKVLPNLPSYITVEVDDENHIRFHDFSYGEKRVINLIYSILYYVDFYQMEDTYINLFLDELDIGFHPEWQKKIFNIIVNIFLVYKIDIRIIILTHSPFILSDIPKQNIIFLDKNEDGTCKVVDGLKEKKQTFGANIHTLLSDSFFMEDGLMGEFAKGKIDEVIQLLNKEKLDEKELKYCEQIIFIVGEPIVKNQLQRMLDSKRLKKVDEIDAIKRSMDEMQKRLDELEK